MPLVKNAAGTDRRSWLKSFGLGAVAAGVAGRFPLLSGEPARAGAAAAGRSIRIAHLTDVHLQPERGAVEAFTQCLHHVQSQVDRPDLILFTGDLIMDSYRKDDARTALQWDLWNRVLKAECSLPHMALLGNHDIWGWDKKKSKTTGNEPGWGKRRACDHLELARPYYSFDRNGWHFVMLDSVQPFGDGKEYLARLDAEQMAWLAGDLEQHAGRPTIVLSHIPIFSVTPLMGIKPGDGITPDGRHQSVIGQGGMHTDWRELKALFRQHGNVTVALSGHMHLIDRVDYLGTSYLCGGAVSGGWWKEVHLGEGDAGYSLIDLYDDGRFAREYVTYGWKYKDAPVPTTNPVSAAH
jgi:hypothetical protein